MERATVEPQSLAHAGPRIKFFPAPETVESERSAVSDSSELEWQSERESLNMWDAICFHGGLSGDLSFYA